MSDEEVTVETSDGQILAAEYKDGQLQIVEVTPFEKDRDQHILPDIQDSSDGQTKYLQVLDPGKGLMQLDLLNLTLVKCGDGDESYQLVANAASTSDGEISSDATVTCVLQSSDNEDGENQDSYVMVKNSDIQGPLMFLKSALAQDTSPPKQEQPKKPLTPAEILEKAKALQKAKALASAPRRNRKRKSDLPPPHELLASPNFKLYLYSCKMCSYKCNAVKDMSAHKAAEHGSGGSRGRGGGHRGQATTLQCARCPYRANTHTQLMKHVQEKHMEKTTLVGNTVQLDTEEVEAADVLVCGACGFESGSRSVFKKHIEDEHGATTC